MFCNIFCENGLGFWKVGTLQCIGFRVFIWGESQFILFDPRMNKEQIWWEPHKVSSRFLVEFLLRDVLYNFPKLISFRVSCQNQWDGALIGGVDQIYCVHWIHRDTYMSNANMPWQTEQYSIIWWLRREKRLEEFSLWKTAHFIFLKGLGLCLIFNHLKYSVHFNHENKELPSITHNYWQAYPFWGREER